MADADLVPMPERATPLPDPIRFDMGQPLRFTPKELRILRAQTGRTFTDLMQEEAPVVMAWFRLRREGWPDLRYADLEDVTIEVGEAVAADPLNVQPPTSWPDSAGSGG